MVAVTGLLDLQTASGGRPEIAARDLSQTQASRLWLTPAAFQLWWVWLLSWV